MDRAHPCPGRVAPASLPDRAHGEGMKQVAGLWLPSLPRSVPLEVPVLSHVVEGGRARLSAELEGKQCRACHLTGLEGSRELLGVKRQVERVSHQAPEVAHEALPCLPASDMSCRSPSPAAATLTCLFLRPASSLPPQRHLAAVCPQILAWPSTLYHVDACFSKSHLFRGLF